MRRISAVLTLLLPFAIALLIGGCGDDSSSTAQPLSAQNTNLVFVVSPDVAYHTSGDINPETANLSNQGLQRSLLMAPYLKQQVLGGQNVTSIYALEPTTHLQTANEYPDMAAIGFIQQFALLNQITLPVDSTGDTYTGYSYPINASYAEGAVPVNVAPPTSPSVQLGLPQYCPDCTGLDFNDAGGDNDTLVTSLIDKKNPGYFVFSAPWETVRALLTQINTQYGYNLPLPATYQGTNYIFAISIPSSGGARLVTYNSKLTPPTTAPVLPSPVTRIACTDQPLSYTRAGGVNGVTIPANINTNSTIYIVRHAEAHPDQNFKFDDGNYVAAGQWRAFSLATALKDKITKPDVVYSIDPAGTWYPNGADDVSYIRPSLTVLPYVIANNLPYKLASKLSLGSAFDPTNGTVAQDTMEFFFTGGTFTGKTVLVAWESGHIKPFLEKLIESYGGNAASFAADWDNSWPSADYDTIWTVKLDAQGNLTVDNASCEGIDSAKLPVQAPMF
jgi:hypothetical protein